MWEILRGHSASDESPPTFDSISHFQTAQRAWTKEDARVFPLVGALPDTQLPHKPKSIAQTSSKRSYTLNH